MNNTWSKSRNKLFDFFCKFTCNYKASQLVVVSAVAFKHKLFVYPEDFEKFTGALADAMRFIYEQQGPVEQRPEEPRNEIQLDEIEF